MNTIETVLALEVAYNFDSSRNFYSWESDIYSVGCVLYFLFTNGCHPFLHEAGGPLNSFNCQAQESDHIITGFMASANRLIKKGRDFSACYTLKALDHIPEASHLISKMLGGPTLDRTKRWRAGACLRHPVFWSPVRKLRMLEHVANLLKRLNLNTTSGFEKQLLETLRRKIEEPGVRLAVGKMTGYGSSASYSV